MFHGTGEFLVKQLKMCGQTWTLFYNIVTAIKYGISIAETARTTIIYSDNFKSNFETFRRSKSTE